MSRSLRAVMAEILSGWPSDLDPAWRNVIDGVTLGFEDIDPELRLEAWEPVFPARRGKRFPGAPDGAHMLRAFDGPPPDAVRCVILGQDPYPCPAFATGRAFEAGNVARWRELEKMFSCSIRVLLQLICAAQSGNPDYARCIADWPATIAAVEAGAVAIAAPGALLDAWVRQGVLALNASLTLSRFAVAIDPHQSRGHLPLWRPLQVHVLRHLATRANPPVFMGFGAAAADTLRQAGIASAILREHPAAGDAVLTPENPFAACNAALAAAGAKPIRWGGD